jgi:hypothetical protein
MKLPKQTRVATVAKIMQQIVETETRLRSGFRVAANNTMTATEAAKATAETVSEDKL